MYELWIIITAILTALSCALVGSLLILRRMAMLGDAISHSVLLGIVISYLLFDTLALPALLFGALLAGLVTAWLSTAISQRSIIQPDASLGLVFIWMFALALVLIALFADRVHLDHHHIVFGEMAFLPFERWRWMDLDLGPRAFWIALSLFIVNLCILLVAFERFRLTTFAPSFALSLGISVGFWHYLLVSMVSVTAVAAFDLMGSILVVAFLVIPGATAYLISQQLKTLLVLASIYAISAVLLGFGLAWWLDTALSAAMAFMSGMLFVATLIIQGLHHRYFLTPINVQRQQNQNDKKA
ncbi:metal ABC transporter permease [Thiomicrospira cyclica]|uniref:ABC-type transporter, integral membrane subunit n=1 Tax=Thiomicrospira cyclica (strain DSM 14477 / JCM 11371 / ALM1) TaxID=717773 RepID=F6DC53_THICA|nr:metal ABC transporter permease [Thiomicrospira cyclica]AEG31439.1 ABC-type transporter, integral membrane subunit [Thiomicrospira cyclica ALM1]